MHNMILWVRYLRRVLAFKIGVRAVVISLMLLGSWVATRKLNFPPELSLNDKFIHMVVFFGFAFLMDLAISRRPFWLWKGLPLLAYGAIIEIMQYFSPDRSFSILDWVADFSGILLYFIMKSIALRLSAIKPINVRY